MRFYRTTLSLAVCSLLAACSSGHNTTIVTPTKGSAVTIHMVGDSTMANYEHQRPQMGWGEALPKFFDQQTAVNNWARGGRSSLSYHDYSLTGVPHWPNIKPAIAEGDYVIIQFGHNDQKTAERADYNLFWTYAFCNDGNNSTADDAENCKDKDRSYYLNLKSYVEDVKAAGATPILISPIVRGYFESSEITEKGQHNLTELNKDEPYARGNYPAAMEALAARYNIAYVDLTEATKKIVESYGQEKAYNELYTYDKVKSTSTDRTHPVELFATLIAQAAAEGIKANPSLTELQAHIVEYKAPTQ
ncbi:rhamnogalacturonan acetylesterase [Vibrio ziniensis]|uniref:Rhamnogalacturonan acetylesterase n=1 Tax=Vibrio ziniensis TaxID=2711221 RepID=A0A6G7CF21_9VIBR|nr:rhamnogalacturonan acetylesterase [Vibrio ziniensis]QIH40646.1 rhamnogalacturonan acetylesterase [Vibrio ziniensis]QOT69940.1 rhamnogalacturonan acetylesterase [Vibrio ziniensis]